MAAIVPQWNSKLVDGVTFAFADAQTTKAVCELVTEPDCAYLVKAEVLMVDTDTYAEAAGYVMTGVFRNAAGVLTQVGSTDVDVTIEDRAGWAAELYVATPNVQVRVTTDEAAHNVSVRTRLSVLRLGKSCPHQWGASTDRYYGAAAV